jgi:hypothetical protein
MCVLAWLFRLSSLVNFISETILLGFKAGAALTIAMTQLPKLFGVKGGGHGFFESVVTLAGQLPDTNFAVLAFGLAALAVLLLGEKFLPGRPVALFVVVISILVLSVTPLGISASRSSAPCRRACPTSSCRICGARCGRGDPAGLRLPVAGLRGKRFRRPRPGAGARLRDRSAPGTCSAWARRIWLRGFFQAYPVAGGLSQSSVNDKAGAKTPLALVFASLTIGLCLMYLTGMLYNLPNVVLAAIVLVAVKGLVNIGELRHVWRVSRFEFGVSMVAFAGVLLLGILKGVIVAVVVSMLVADPPRGAPACRFPGPNPRHPELLRQRAQPGQRAGRRGVAVSRRILPALLQRRARARSALAEDPRKQRSARPGGLRSVHFAGGRSGRRADAGQAASGTAGSRDSPAAGRGACGGARHPARRRIGGKRRLLRPADHGGRRHRRVSGSPLGPCGTRRAQWQVPGRRR